MIIEKWLPCVSAKIRALHIDSANIPPLIAEIFSLLAGSANRMKVCIKKPVPHGPGLKLLLCAGQKNTEARKYQKAPLKPNGDVTE